jgi:hypothetical protein
MTPKPYLSIAVVGFVTVLSGCGQSADTSKSVASGPAATAPSPTSASTTSSMAAVGASKPLSRQGLTPDQETAALAAQGASDKSAPSSPGVGTEGTSAVGDATISSEVEAAIKAEPALEAQPITVEANNATVTLSGSVAKDSLRSQAGQIAMSVPGVKNVVNHLAVQPS